MEADGAGEEERCAKGYGLRVMIVGQGHFRPALMHGYFIVFTSIRNEMTLYKINSTSQSSAAHGHIILVRR